MVNIKNKLCFYNTVAATVAATVACCIPIFPYPLVTHAMPKKAKAAPDAATAHVEELTFPEGSRDGFDSASDEEYDEQSEPESLGLNSEEGDDETADDSDGEDGGPFSDASASGSDMERDILDIARAGEEDGQAFGGQRSDGVDVWMRGHATTLCISIHSVDPGSDSSDDELPNVNTVGNIPLQWYKDEDHIGMCNVLCRATAVVKHTHTS